MKPTNNPANDSLIDADEICVVREGRHILDRISINIKRKDFITIVGPNGAGKSMLLKCLMGFYPPDAGQIKRKPGLKLGYVPQRIHAEQNLPITVSGFLQLRRRKGHERGHGKGIEKLAIIAAETQIETLLDQALHVLSGGELQRVLLARALLNEPELLVMDEPAQNLDISGQLAFYTLLETIIAKRDLSLLMVSHDLHLVMASTSQVICLYHHVCCSGTPQAVSQDPEFVSLFGQDMSKMLAMYQHSHDHSHDHNHEHTSGHSHSNHQHCDHA